MAEERTAKCVICGASPTVKSHLLPRSLALDIRGSAPNLVHGSAKRDGYLVNQNGVWDDSLLCSTHEEQSGLGDKYAVELIRSLETKGKPRPEGGFSLPNPKPALLQHFVYSTV